VEERLIERLVAARVDPATMSDGRAAWRRLHEREGVRATLIDRYAIEAAIRRVPVAALDAAVRAELAVEVLSARDPGWPDRFEAWRGRLQEAIGPAARRVEHVGSTAMPGLPAKPVIDIQVSVDDVEAETAYLPAIEALGVALRSRESGHRYFRPAGTAPRDAQIHVCGRASHWERVHLLFRDYLRASRWAAEAYAMEKRAAARAFPGDRIAYNEAKSGFILDTLADAGAWSVATGWRP
jgi:GrpB-like predicted nucleotidyltransferase (UPF0157 family)